MGNALKAIDIVELTTSFQTIYTVPAVTKFVVGMIHLNNETNVARTVQLCVVPSAGTAGSSNSILWNFSIAANDFVEFYKGDILNAGSTIQALASANSAVTLKMSGIEST